MDSVGTVLFAADPLRPGRVDPHFAAQAEAVRELGGTVKTVDHDALAHGDAEGAARRVDRDLGPAWYRGWMIPAVAYRALATALAGRGTPLVVGPGAYVRAHHLPGWYPLFAEATPASVWWAAQPGEVPGEAELARALAPLGGGAGMVKDYVKSRKDAWADACHIPELSDTPAALAVVRRFVELQGEYLEGGVVVRAFEPFEGTDGRAAEARVWWRDGEPVLVAPHPDSPGELVEPDVEPFRPLVDALACRFVTTDLARRTDGRWRLVELGDAQVSDAGAGVPPDALARMLLGLPMAED
ncbi:hypothetical protein CLV72_101486 [Allonocardiopsis opalescens]|uniref:ATP-grasp domain-containing protein n=2 Tax=Allonocardiopsis opalescens TaxID=1144618 RepID=A0A2T0QDA6_9ACTN|nr:hypothetical protein CLV72_101486 [Allonocardiopsis opalescens]